MTFTVQNFCNIFSNEIRVPANLREQVITTPITDSRSLTDAAHTVFFAICTATGDGHRYIDRLYAAGVRVFVCDMRRVRTAYDDAVWIDTPSPLQALQKVGEYIGSTLSESSSMWVVGITGSIGKTVVKEMLNRMIINQRRVARSPRSWNSQIGVPLSMWQLERNTQVALIEAGVSHSGEMESQQRIIRPNLGIFTTFTDEHSRGFKSPEEKCREKALLFKDCCAIAYIDNPLVSRVLSEMYPHKRLLPCSEYDSLCRNAARAMGVNEFPECGQTYGDSCGISSRIDFSDTTESVVLAYDHFTCDVQSIAVALDLVRRRIPQGVEPCALLGDLLCRDDERDEAYRRLEELLHTFGVHVLVAVGPEISDRARNFGPGIEVRCFDSAADAMSQLNIYDFFDNMVYINGGDKRAFGEIYTWLNSSRNITRLEINLDALAANFRHYRSLLPPETGLIGMVKASAYGCGAPEVARTLQTQGADMVAVAVVDEGVALRKAGVTLPVIVLDPWCENMRAIFAYSLQPTLIDAREQTLLTLERAADSQGVQDIRVHVKLDTGMHRVGLSESEIPAFVDMIKRHPRIHVETTFSHLATADCLDLDAYTDMQVETFKRMSAALIEGLGYPVKRHLLNTAGISRLGDRVVFELARLGIGLYGITPLDEADRMYLRPVARLVSRIIAKRSYPAGTKVGYGCHGDLNRPSVIGTVPIGYADGIDRKLGNGHAHFWVNGYLCPTVGNICMDLCMIDLTDCPDTGDDSVEIFGDNTPIERLSDAIGTIPYEVLARVSPRVKRVYYRE